MASDDDGDIYVEIEALPAARGRASAVNMFIQQQTGQWVNVFLSPDTARQVAQKIEQAVKALEKGSNA